MPSTHARLRRSAPPAALLTPDRTASLAPQAIFVLLNSKSDNDERRSSSSGGGIRMGMYYNPFDMFWYWDPYYYQARSFRRTHARHIRRRSAKLILEALLPSAQRTRMRMQEDPYYEMNFLESVFSFVFGAFIVSSLSSFRLHRAVSMPTSLFYDPQRAVVVPFHS